MHCTLEQDIFTAERGSSITLWVHSALPGQGSHIIVYNYYDVLYCTLTFRQTAEQVLPLMIIKNFGRCCSLLLLLPSPSFSNFALNFTHGSEKLVWSETERLNNILKRRKKISSKDFQSNANSTISTVPKTNKEPQALR